MSARRLLIAAAAIAALGACTKNSAPTPGLNLAEPTALAVFHGVVSQYASDTMHPYLAIASAVGNELVIVDAVNDVMVPGPFPLRALVYPVANRPTLLASAPLGDGKPDLLVAVSQGGSALQVIRTWREDGAVDGQVDLPGDVLALAALEPTTVASTAGALPAAQLAAVLSGQRVALVTIPRAASSFLDPTAVATIDVGAASALWKVSAPLGFQPLDVARSPFQPGQVWVATQDGLGGGVHGVAGLDLATMVNGGTPTTVALNALAPTRLVAAAQVRERRAGEDSWTFSADLLGTDAVSYAGTTVSGTGTLPPLVNRVYAVLDESGCGPARPIACGLVALDPTTGALALDPVLPSPDPTIGSSMIAPFRAPLPIPGPLSLAVAVPPALGPLDEPQYAVSITRVRTALGSFPASAVAAVPASDGAVWWVDLSRWEIPSQQLLQSSMAVAVASHQPPVAMPPIPKDQWLVFQDPNNPTTNVKHSDTAGLASTVITTPGYTPTEAWMVVKEGLLPNLYLRKAEAGVDGTGLWLALQAPGGRGDVLRVWDPTLGVQPGDIVVIDPVGLGTCGEFEATVSSVEPPSASPSAPGGFLRLAKRGVTGHGDWDGCVDTLTAVAGPPSSGPGFSDLLVSIRAGDYVLLRGTGANVRAVGRPQIGTPFALEWGDESAGACTLPPAVDWPLTGSPDTACRAGTPCRARCDALVRIRNARRLGYATERCVVTTSCGAAGTRWPQWPDPFGPAIGFTLALESAAPAHRDLALTIATGEGRNSYRIGPSSGSINDPRAAVPFDRSPYDRPSGVRFLTPYLGGFVLDGSPSDGSGGELR